MQFTAAGIYPTASYGTWGSKQLWRMLCTTLHLHLSFSSFRVTSELHGTSPCRFSVESSLNHRISGEEKLKCSMCIDAQQTEQEASLASRYALCCGLQAFTYLLADTGPKRKACTTQILGKHSQRNLHKGDRGYDFRFCLNHQPWLLSFFLCTKPLR